MNYFYITPEQYESAAKNGISAKTLERRIRNHAWDMERAITQPSAALKRKNHKEWIKLAEQNGISKEVYYSRVNYMKWSQERAATEPVSKNRSDMMKRIRKESENKVISKELITLAESNGIKYDTLYRRIKNYKWDPVKAATEPVMSVKESTERARESYRQRYGHAWSRYAPVKGTAK